MKITSIFNSLKQPKAKKKSKKIISFDGGGVRAIAGIVFLKKFEEETGQRVFNTFDMFVGTSAGALNAACFACDGLSAKEVKKYWSQEYLDKVMETSFFWDQASLIQARPRYETKGRVEILKELFKNKNLSDSIKPLLTLCYDIERREHVIHSSFETPDISFIDSVCASSAAPMYFPTYQISSGSWMIDGGVVTNNPSIIGYIKAKKYFNTDNIKVLSIGAGLNKNKIKGESSSKCGGVGWLRNDIIGMVLDSEIHNDIATNLLDKNYLRINSSLGNINKMLDDASSENLEKIHKLGLNWWEEFGQELINFIND